MEASGILPRTTVRTTDVPPGIAVPLDSTRLLLGMESFRGTTDPVRITSPLDLSRNFERTGVGIPAFDAIDVALREGVPEVWLARLLGPAAASASVALAGAAGASLTLRALEPGEWGNGATGGLTAEVVNGPAGATERVIIVRRNTAPAPTELGRTTAESTRADLLAAVERVAGVKLTADLGPEVGLPNVAGPANFAGGTADATAITTADVRAALDRVPLDQGPMQVATPGRSTDTTNEEVLSYASASDRTALLEQTDGLAVGAIGASAAVLRALGTGAEGVSRLGGLWAQHATGPGIVPGSTRTVPWSIVVAGLTARLEHQEGHPNVAPFGDFGVPRWATGLTREFSEADSETLFAAGVNLAHTTVLGVRNRTFRTLEASGASQWVDLAHTRTERAIRGHARDVGRGMGARTIDRKTLSEFGTLLRGRLERHFWKPGALFGDTPDQAFRVDTDSVNDATTIAAREANAAVGVRMSEHAEYVNIDLAKVPIGQEV